MRQTISATKTPSITIVQGAYEKFCTPSEADTICATQQFTSVIDAFDFSIAVATTQEVWARFQSHYEQWRHQRGAMSSITEAATLPAYQNIIGMGETAVPFILSALRAEGDEPDQWFWALRAITGVDPVKDENRGNYVNMASDWFDWAHRSGYAW